PPPTSTVFPYTTLFRSLLGRALVLLGGGVGRPLAALAIGHDLRPNPSGAGVAAEQPRRGELAELVPDHRLADEHGHVLAPVVDGDRKSTRLNSSHDQIS